MNNVRSLYYFIYWNILLLISFRKVDGFPSEEIEERIQQFPNEENNTAQRTEGEFTWFYEGDYNKSVDKLESTVDSLLNKVEEYLNSRRLFGRPSGIEILVEMKNFLWETLNDKMASHVSELHNLCNEAWAKYSDGTAGSVSSVTTSNIPVYSSEEVSVELPVLLCENPQIPNFRFFMMIFEDRENPIEDTVFIYKRSEIITINVFYLRGYMYKVFQNHTDGNI